MLNSLYPNSYTRMHKSPENVFLYIFISLYPLVRVFEYYRTVIKVDMSHLGGAYNGTFISISILDGVNMGHINISFDIFERLDKHYK